MAEKRTSISSKVELDHARSLRDIAQELRNRHEAGIIGDILDAVPDGGLTFKELLTRVQDRVETDRADGLTPPFNIRPILIAGALGIMRDLRAVVGQPKLERWSLTAIGREAVAAGK